MSVLVVNRKTWDKGGTWIGAGGVFGNPYSPSLKKEPWAKYEVSSRDDALDKYREWIEQEWKDNEFFKICITDLVQSHIRGEDVVLACDCDDTSKCHGSILKEYIEAFADFGIVDLETGNDAF